MGSRDEIRRLRLEADTILTRKNEVERALEHARDESGDHWEEGEVSVGLLVAPGSGAAGGADAGSDGGSGSGVGGGRSYAAADGAMDLLDEL